MHNFLVFVELDSPQKADFDEIYVDLPYYNMVEASGFGWHFGVVFLLLEVTQVLWRCNHD